MARLFNLIEQSDDKVVQYLQLPK